MTKSGMPRKLRTRTQGWATLAIVIVLPLLFAPSAHAPEIVIGSWTGVLDAHGEYQEGSPYGSSSSKTDVTVNLKGSAYVSTTVTMYWPTLGENVESEGLHWTADAAWSAHVEEEGSFGGCPYTTTNDVAGSSRTAEVVFFRRSDIPPLITPPPGDSVWVYVVGHSIGSSIEGSGELGPPCSGPYNGGAATAASVGSGFQPLPDGLSTTTLSGSRPEANGTVVDSWQLTREPDEDCDGIPNSQDRLSTLPGCGSDGADAACERAKQKVKKAKQKLQQADTPSEKERAEKKLKKAKKRKREACG